MQRKGSANWQGGLKKGSGTVSTGSKVLSNTAFSFRTRFEGAPGTNPEELIAAAHAACFSMALSAELEKQGAKSSHVATEASAKLEQVKDQWTVTEMFLDVVADVEGIGADAFQRAADSAKKNCPISRLLNTKITLSTKLNQKVA